MAMAINKQNKLKEEKANISKGNLRKDEDIKVNKGTLGEDNSMDILHPQRFFFRTPLTIPNKYWEQYPIK